MISTGFCIFIVGLAVAITLLYLYFSTGDNIACVCNKNKFEFDDIDTFTCLGCRRKYTFDEFMVLAEEQV